MSIKMESAETARWVLEEDDLLSCCGSTKFAKQMSVISPFLHLHHALEVATDIWFNKVDVCGWLEAFSAHPQTGQSSSSPHATETSSQWSKGEQSATLETVISPTLQELTEWNARYKEKFGFVFLICASGRSTAEILAELKRRYSNRPVVEFEIAAEEQMKLTKLSLAKLFTEKASTVAVTDYQPASVSAKANNEKTGGNSTNFGRIPEQQTPQPNSEYYEQSPHVYQESNSFNECEDEEETVPKAPHYRMEPIMLHQLPVTANQQPRQVASSTRWSIREDEALIASYMEHCTNAAIKKTNQKASVLWRKVLKSYNVARASRPFELPERSMKMMENRWRRMAPDINLWVGCLEEATKLTGNGNNGDDVIQTAHMLFRKSTKPTRSFLCEHAWKMVTVYPKWRRKMRWGMSKKERQTVDVDSDAEDSGSSGKRSRLDSSGDTVIGSGNYTSGGILLPDGVKKSKAKCKGRGFQAHTEVRGQAINQQQEKLDFEKEKLKTKQKQLQLDEMKTKFDILQTLMSKSSLDPSEEKFKDKLCIELYGDN